MKPSKFMHDKYQCSCRLMKRATMSSQQWNNIYSMDFIYRQVRISKNEFFFYRFEECQQEGDQQSLPYIWIYEKWKDTLKNEFHSKCKLLDHFLFSARKYFKYFRFCNHGFVYWIFKTKHSRISVNQSINILLQLRKSFVL